MTSLHRGPPRSSPWGQALGWKPYWAQLVHRYAKLNATSQVWKIRGTGSFEVTGDNVGRCGVAQGAQTPACHAHCLAYLDWKGSGAPILLRPLALALRLPALGGRCLRPGLLLWFPCLRGNLQTQPEGNHEALPPHRAPWSPHRVRGHERAAICVQTPSGSLKS